MKVIFVVLAVIILGCSHEHVLTEHEHGEKPHEHELAKHEHEEIVEQLQREMREIYDPQPIAVQAKTSPADGGVITQDSSITITLDEAVESVTIGGVSTIGSGKTWVINSRSINLGLGRQTLVIHWVNKDGSTGSDSVTWIVV